MPLSIVGYSSSVGGARYLGQRAVPPPEGAVALDPIDIITAPFDALGWLTDQLLVFLRALFLRYGVPIVFVAGLAEATVGVGVLFPGVIIMFLGGAATANDPARLALVFVAALAGTVTGDIASYTLGRVGGSRLQSTRFGPPLRLGQALIAGRARWLIPLYHLYSVTRAVGPFGAGAFRLPLLVWLPLDILGAFVSNVVWVGAGALLGAAVLTPEGKLEPHPLLRLGLAAAGVAWFLLLRRTMQRRMQALARESASTPDEDGDEAASTALEPAAGRSPHR